MLLLLLRSSLGCGVWIIMLVWENGDEVDPSGGYEAGKWGRPGCGDCCRDCACDWNPFRIKVSDWVVGNVGLSPRVDSGGFLPARRL